MKNAVLAIAVAVLSASPAFAGGFGTGQTSTSAGGLVSVGGVNVSALNGSGGVLSNIASGNRTVLNNVANGNRTNVLGVQGVTGVVRGLLGGGSNGCGCN